MVLYSNYSKKSIEIPCFGENFIYKDYTCKITDINIEYAKNFVLNSLINKISTDIGSLIPYTNINNSELSFYLKYPNVNQTWFQFVKDLSARYEIDNEVWVYNTLNDNGTINSSVVIPKKDISNIKYDTITGNIVSCYVNLCDGKQIFVKMYSDIFMDKRNTLWKLSGFDANSRFQYQTRKSNYLTVKNSLDYCLTATEYTNSYLKNGAQPAWALLVQPQDGYDVHLSDEDRDKITRSWNDKYNGSMNAGRLVILEGGLQLQSLSTDIDKLNFDEGFESAITFCCMVANISPSIIGYSKDSSSQYKVDDQAKIAYYNNKICPMGRNIYEFLEKNILFRYKRFSIDNFLTFDDTKIPSIMKERYEVAKIATESEALTKNEIRKMLNLKPVKDGDMVYVNIGSMPIDLITKNATTREMMNVDNTK